MSSSPPSPIDSVQREHVHLPPRRHSDFIIHYQKVDFHVHKFVLHHHSTYFRAYFESLTPLAEVQQPAEEEKQVSRTSRSAPARKRVKRKAKVEVTSAPSSSSSSSTTTCDHPTLIQCIHLPEQCGMEEADDGDFMLFLRHLYFSSILHCPPFGPDWAIEGQLKDDTPVSLTFPTTTPSEDILLEYTGGDLNIWSQLLSLFHYFDCQSALQRCDVVIAAWNQEEVGDVWHWLSEASRYGLKGLARHCINELTVRGTHFETDEQATSVWAQLPAAVQFEVVNQFALRQWNRREDLDREDDSEE